MLGKVLPRSHPQHWSFAGFPPHSGWVSEPLVKGTWLSCLFSLLSWCSSFNSNRTTVFHSVWRLSTVKCFITVCDIKIEFVNHIILQGWENMGFISKYYSSIGSVEQDLMNTHMHTRMYTHTHTHTCMHTYSLPSAILNIRQNWSVVPTSFCPPFYLFVYVVQLQFRRKTAGGLILEFDRKRHHSNASPESQLGTTCPQKGRDLSPLTGLDMRILSILCQLRPLSPGEATCSLLPCSDISLVF